MAKLREELRSALAQTLAGLALLHIHNLTHHGLGASNHVFEACNPSVALRALMCHAGQDPRLLF